MNKASLYFYGEERRYSMPTCSVEGCGKPAQFSCLTCKVKQGLLVYLCENHLLEHELLVHKGERLYGFEILEPSMEKTEEAPQQEGNSSKEEKVH